jgi:hypothetical protein
MRLWREQYVSHGPLEILTRSNVRTLSSCVGPSARERQFRAQKFVRARNLFVWLKIYNGDGASNGRLDSKVAIITGAGTGIGEAIAHKFAREGARVMVSGLPDDPIEDVAQSICVNGGKAIAHGADVSEERGAREVIDLTLTEFKRIASNTGRGNDFLSL